jgi:hypothetical protein
MEFCAGCGHRLGVGRFCTNCGRPIAAPASEIDTVQRPEVHVPSSPPPAFTPPPAARYPLFSDEVRTAPPSAPPPSSPPPTYHPVAPRPRPQRAGPSFLPVALITVFLMLVAVIGGLLLFAGGDEDQADDPTPVDSSAQSESGPPSSKPPRDKGPTKAPPTEGTQDVARYATATAPSTAKPNLDTSGNMVRYDASNMVDGVPSTCWRTAGDGTGLELTFTFPQPVELTEVGLINGYAKSSGALDWYAGNRRVLAATWVFDDGTEVPQSFTETRRVQSVSVDPITTSTVVLRLDSVSEVGKGPSARNNTAISDVSLVGAAA